jgi:hypothetical protein
LTVQIVLRLDLLALCQHTPAGSHTSIAVFCSCTCGGQTSFLRMRALRRSIATTVTTTMMI